jgi:hypothetical protein
MGDCAICSEPAAGVFSYGTHNGSREAEEPLCRHCGCIVSTLASVKRFEPGDG